MSLADRVFEKSPLWLRSLGFNAHAARLARFREGAPMQERLAALDALDRDERPAVERAQADRLNALISWCAERVPYYRERWPGRPPRIVAPADLAALPILTKDEVRRAGRALRAAGVSHHEGHTSGTTGTPLHLSYDVTQRVWNRAAERLVRVRAGLPPGAPVAVVWGRKVVPPERGRPPYWLRNAVDNELWLSAFHISRATIRDYVEAIRGFGAVALETYPSIASLLAVLVRDERLELRLSRVLTTSETLYPAQRDTIEEVFGAEVYDYYGAAERVAFAVECRRHEGLHLLEGFGYVEPGTAGGGFVATGFTNRAMPLLRYHVTDATRVLEEPCGCGLTSRRLAPVTTKQEDVLVAPDGRFVSPSILTHPFKPLVGLVRSQIVQEALDRVVVSLETGPAWDPRQERGIAAGLAERMGPGVAIEIRRVERLEPERSGKFRWVVCKVPHAQRPAAPGGVRP